MKYYKLVLIFKLFTTTISLRKQIKMTLCDINNHNLYYPKVNDISYDYSQKLEYSTYSQLKTNNKMNNAIKSIIKNNEIDFKDKIFDKLLDKLLNNKKSNNEIDSNDDNKSNNDSESNDNSIGNSIDEYNIFECLVIENSITNQELVKINNNISEIKDDIFSNYLLGLLNLLYTLIITLISINKNNDD